MRTNNVQSTNPVAVGDQVNLEQKAGGDYVIDHVLERRNYIIRKSTNLSKQTHIIAANIDLAIIMASLVQP